MAISGKLFRQVMMRVISNHFLLITINGSITRSVLAEAMSVFVGYSS